MPVDFVAERRCPECGQDSDDQWLPFCGEKHWRVFDEAMAKAVRGWKVPTQRKQPETARAPEPPYGPGAICGECGHFACRHGEADCQFPRPADNPCGCAGMLWQGYRWKISAQGGRDPVPASA